MSDFLIRRDDLRSCRVEDSPAPEPAAGEALLRVDSFGLSANNVTYAVFGEAMSYWEFFPAPEGWGRMPVWGFAEVERSEAAGLEPGTRLFGYLPPSSRLVIEPSPAGEGRFVDRSAHRRPLPGAYQLYTDSAADPLHRPETEAIQMLMRPLFVTSLLIDDQLDDDGLLERGPVLMASASSKTAIGAAFLLSQRPGAEVIALTSAANVGFVEGLGIYARTLSYDEMDALEPGPATFVDFAGDAALRQAVHGRYGDALVHSMAVGMTHYEGGMPSGGAELPGPAPVLFFAPDRVAKRSADWGEEGFGERVSEAWHPFCEWVGEWLEVIPGRGFEALERAYRELLDGSVEPRAAHVLSL